jgi:hypothetical protein
MSNPEGVETVRTRRKTISLNPLTSLTPLTPKEVKEVKEVNDSKAPAALLLKRLESLGFDLYLEGAMLRWRGPAGVLTDIDRDEIRAHKPELLALLSVSTSVETQPLPTSASTCGSTLRAYRYDLEQALSTFLAEHPTLKPTPKELEELRAKYFTKLPSPGVTCDRCVPIKVPNQHHNNWNGAFNERTIDST